ncbi:hypothetical protein Efla_005521 [Eimeria flavescens]
MRARVFLALLAGAAAATGAAADGRAVCLRRLSFDGQPPQDQREQPFQSCKKHAANTCCYPQHTELVQRRLNALADSPQCKKVSEEVLCVLCDPRFGTGIFEKKGNPVICPQLCSDWFAACQDAFVAAAPTGSGHALTFCDSGSLICSPLSTTVEDSRSFCRGLGYEVLEEESEEGGRRGRCFDGVPLAASAAAPRRRDRERAEGSEQEAADSMRRWLLQWRLWLQELLDRPEVWLLVLMLAYFTYQGIQLAKDIIKTYLLEERQQHRQQILLRYDVEEDEDSAEEEEEEDVSAHVSLSEEEETEDKEESETVEKRRKKD